MYNLDTRGSLCVITSMNHELVRVAAEDVSVRDAFRLVEQLEETEGAYVKDPEHGYDVQQWVYVFVPAPHDRTEVLAAVRDGRDPDDARSLWHMRGDHVDTTQDAACFSWGPELTDDEYEEHGFARAVWSDGGGPRRWYPAD